MPEISSSEWDKFLSGHPEAHILQTSAWGELKHHYGWKAIHITQGDCGVQILIQKVFPGIHLAYIPKGPVGEGWLSLLPEVDQVCQKLHCVFLKIEPDSWEDSDSIPPSGFISSTQSIQPPRTLVVDLQADAQTLLGRMKQKTRYNINLALKRGVNVYPTADLDVFHSLVEMTSQRDRFGVHETDYYRRAYQLFHPSGQCELLMAEYKHIPLAAVMVFAYGRRAWYFYGGSSNQHRERMPNYLLQWEAMRWAHGQGCSEYDLWGIPDADPETLETNFTHRSDGLWGVYRFKRGFGGQLRRSTGPWDRVYLPLPYLIYQLWQRLRKKE